MERLTNLDSFRLLTFREILGRRMKELGSGSFIAIVVLDVE